MRWTRRGIARGAIACAAVAALRPKTGRAHIPRVERIRRRVEPDLVQAFSEAGLSYPPRVLFLRVFKHEKVLEMWAADHRDDELALIEAHPICYASGKLGPKRQSGDCQVPEGAYEIDFYNGWSAYHLSMRVSYPNASDRRRGTRGNLGGAIMIHGDCVSIGCIAIEDRPIERVFLSALAAQKVGHRLVPVHIFPTQLDEEGQAMLRPLAATDLDRSRLWSELAPIYAAFEETLRVPEVEIDPRTGAYRLK